MSGKKSNLTFRLPSDLLSEQAFQAPADGVGGRVGFSGWRAAPCSPASNTPVPMAAAACMMWGLPAQKETCKLQYIHRLS